MKVLAINGSARKDGNTAILIRRVFAELEKEGIETELVQLAGHIIRGCTACNQCRVRLDRRCAIENDIVNDCIAKMTEADGIILGSPTYFADITPEIKALIDRSGRVGGANGGLYRRKVGSGVIAVRRGGAIHALDTIQHFLHITQMIVPGASYWNVGIGREVGDVEQDEEGIRNMEVLGENMAWLLKRLHDPRWNS
jgi:multimeric flavodoxin WrbA